MNGGQAVPVLGQPRWGACRMGGRRPGKTIHSQSLVDVKAVKAVFLLDKGHGL